MIGVEPFVRRQNDLQQGVGEVGVQQTFLKANVERNGCDDLKDDGQ